MNTTLLFIELLITGLQASLWILLLILSISGYGWLQGNQLKDISNWVPLITLFVLSFAYAIGITIDRVADTIFGKWSKKIGKRIIPNTNRPISALRFELGKENEYLNNQFEYTRSRIRIARASSFNFLLTTVFATIFIWTQLSNLSNGQRWLYTLITIGVGNLFGGLSVYAWYELIKTYYQLVKFNYDR